MRPYPDAGKALRQIERRDAKAAAQYRAELRYFHCPQRAVLGMSTVYAIFDETHTWEDTGALQAPERFRRQPGATA
ncbi:hypothetical protein PV383_44075 [Streptomyces caniscabiei]|uniref:Uncharacterized protein n=1 Tax=Streptomyces caniscabiei TaxID=2746961 RepID=A0ABU4N3J4_9ACTN|nr:hypothetical protein [Streptomyces caniscabiei]MDX3044093.1 hypothetical protein [Streptomyces caniscabiei]